MKQASLSMWSAITKCDKVDTLAIPLNNNDLCEIWQVNKIMKIDLQRSNI